MAQIKFNFEDLAVWRKGVVFAKEIISLTGHLATQRAHFKITEQLEAAAVSVSANIAEGAGRFSKKEFIKFLYIARGSLYEVVTFLTICDEAGWIQKDEFIELQVKANEISRMLSGLINSQK